MSPVASTKRKKKTTEEIQAELEETGISFTPIGLGPWSHSKLKVLKNCPLKFYLQYVIKMPAPRPDFSLITEVGKAAHRILELSISGKSVSDSYVLTRKEFASVITDDQWAENLESVEYNISKFMQRLEDFDRANGVKRYLQEIRIGCTKDWEPTGFFSEDVYYRSVIDLAIQLKNNDLLIIDHKYGTVSAMGLKNFRDQLNTYKVMFLKGVEKINGAQSGIHHIREGEIVLDEYSPAEEIETDLLNRIQFYIEGAIEALLEKGYFKHVAGNTCKYCDYRTDCKAGNLKEVELASKKWFEIKKI